MSPSLSDSFLETTPELPTHLLPAPLQLSIYPPSLTTTPAVARQQPLSNDQSLPNTVGQPHLAPLQQTPDSTPRSSNTHAPTAPVLNLVVDLSHAASPSGLNASTAKTHPMVTRSQTGSLKPKNLVAVVTRMTCRVPSLRPINIFTGKRP